MAYMQVEMRYLFIYLYYCAEIIDYNAQRINNVGGSGFHSIQHIRNTRLSRVNIRAKSGSSLLDGFNFVYID